MKWEIAVVAVSLLAWIAKSDITGTQLYADVDNVLAWLAGVLWIASLALIVMGLVD